MFKIGDKVFDNERGYGEGVVVFNDYGVIAVDFDKGMKHTYNSDGTWANDSPMTLFKKEEKMKNYYYVGQKVSHQGFGDGVVISTTHDMEHYPILIQFKEDVRSFTVDGRYNRNEYSSISQKSHVPLELEEIISFEKGELVWVKIGDDTWDARYYSHLDGLTHRYFVNQQKSGDTFVAREIRKFSDNPLDLKV